MYWCGPLLGGIVAALLYENVFAVNSSLSKAKGFLLSSDYDPSDYESSKQEPKPVCDGKLHCGTQSDMNFEFIVHVANKFFLCLESYP